MKITLMDIMESLNSDNVEDAQAALHEWFVEQSKQVHQNLTNPVVENAGGTYVLFLDPNDGYDRVWGFQSQNDAAFFMNDIQSYFGSGMYAGVEVAKIVTAEDGYELPTNLAPAGCFNAMKGLEGEAAEDAMNDWSSENEELYSTDAAGHGAEEETDESVVDNTLVSEVTESDDAVLYSVPGFDNIQTDVEVSRDYASMTYEVTSQSGATASIDLDTSIPYYKVAEVAKDSLEEAFARDGVQISDQECSAYADAIANHVSKILEYLDSVEESIEPTFEELVAELSESFKGLETVSDKLQNVEGAQVGEQGKVPVNTKATLPSHKGKDRVGGEPVEIKGKGHNGHALEKAPKVADVKVKNTVQNGKEELKKVADKGDASALLNKRDGKENTQSPISGKGAKGLKK